MLRLVAVLINVMVSLPALAEQRVALVIGNDSYSNVPVLQKAAADARTMAASLSKLGFDVASGVNVSRTETNRKLQDFLNRIEPGDVALFYFAGHGVEITGSNYLLPIDIPEATPGNEEFLKSEAISLNAVLDGLRERKARVTILVIDACRDNPFAIKTGRSVGGARGLALVVPPQGTFIMYSAGAGEAALDRLTNADPEPNSVFTRTFVPLLAQGGLNLPELARETRRRVHELAASAGQSQTPAYYDEVLGDFSFAEGSGAQTAAAPPKPTPLPPPPQPAAPPPEPDPKLARLPEPAPAESPRPHSPKENCSRYGNATFCVSSALPPAQGNNYGARNLVDGNDDTAWVEGSSGQGAGDFVVVEFDTPRTVRGVTVRNGYDKNADIFGKNGRIKDVELVFSSGDSLQATLTDQPGAQHVALNRPVKAKLLVRQAAEALKAVEADLKGQRLGLKVYDCYRPAQAVADFVDWAKAPDDPNSKAVHYPALSKKALFPEGYIATSSGHSRGATMDLTLVPLDAPSAAPAPDEHEFGACTAPQAEREADTSLDMGTGFDCFDVKANTDASGLTSEQRANRQKLVEAMSRRGFKNYDKEWWHYTLDGEPYPTTIFDFPIEPRTSSK